MLLDGGPPGSGSADRSSRADVGPALGPRAQRRRDGYDPVASA